MTNEKNKLDIQVVRDEIFNKYGIAISTDIEKQTIINDINSINLHYIKYQGINSFKVLDEYGNTIIKKYYFIEFNSMPKELIEQISNMIKEKLHNEDYNMSFYECLQYIVSLFRKLTFSPTTKKNLINDVANTLFILQVQKELGKDISKYYNDDNETPLFYFPENNKTIIVKGMEWGKEKIKLNWKELEELKQNKDLIIIEYELSEDGLNIIQLIEKVGIDKSPSIKRKYDKWINFKNIEDDSKTIILTKFLVNIDNIRCYKFDKNLIPIITNLENKSALLDLEITLSTKEIKQSSLEYLNDFLI